MPYLNAILNVSRENVWALNCPYFQCFAFWIEQALSLSRIYCWKSEATCGFSLRPMVLSISCNCKLHSQHLDLVKYLCLRVALFLACGFIDTMEISVHENMLLNVKLRTMMLMKRQVVQMTAAVILTLLWESAWLQGMLMLVHVPPSFTLPQCGSSFQSLDCYFVWTSNLEIARKDQPQFQSKIHPQKGRVTVSNACLAASYLLMAILESLLKPAHSLQVTFTKFCIPD